MKKSAALRKGGDPQPGHGKWKAFFLTPEHLKAYALAIFGGFLAATAYPPFNLYPMVLIAPLLIFWLADRAPTPGAAFRRTLVGGWAFGFGVLHWLCSLILFHPLAPLGIVLLGFYVGLYLGLIGYVLRKCFAGFSISHRWLIFGCMWLLVEWWRTVGVLAQPLVQLGHAWAPVPFLIQDAAILGEHGVSLLVLFLACVFSTTFMMILNRHTRYTPKSIAFTLFGLWLATFSWFMHLGMNSAFPARNVSDQIPGPISIALLQPNVDQMTKLMSYAHPDPRVVAQLTEKLTGDQEAMFNELVNGGYDLIVMPETSFTQTDFNTNPGLQRRISHLARMSGADLVVGAAMDLRGDHVDTVYNAEYFVHADGTFDEQVYKKMRLVPFGEHLPYFDLIPGLESLVGIYSFAAGTEQTVFESGGAKFGSLICFESTFNNLARGLARKDVDFIVVITNDAWYGKSAGAEHHHNVSYLRAVETGRPVVRCANTGISSVIMPDGRRIGHIPLGEKGILSVELSFDQNHRTFYSRIGNTWLFIPFLILLGYGTVAFRTRKSGVSGKSAASGGES